MGVHVQLLLFELLRAKNNANAAAKTFKPIVRYYNVGLCKFESERKWILGELQFQQLTTNQVFNASFVLKRTLPLAYLQKDIFAWNDLTIDNTLFLLL